MLSLGIRTKLFAGFGSLLVLATAIGVVGLLNLRDSSASGRWVYENGLVPVRGLAQARAELGAVDSRTLRAILDPSDRGRGAHQADAEKAAAGVERMASAYEAGQLEEEGRKGLATFRADWKLYQDAFHGVLRLAGAGDTAGAARLYFDQAAPLYGKVDEDLAALITSNDRIAKAHDDGAAATYRRGVAVIGGLVIAAVIVGGVSAIRLSRNISATVSQVAEASQNLARGDLNQKIEVRSRDEFGQMAEAFRAMIAYQNRMAAAADAIANGDLPEGLQPTGEHDVLGLAFQRMVAYLRHMAAVADAIANGDLTQDVQPRSPRDALGLAFQRMTANLRELVSTIQEGAQNLSAVSSQIVAAGAQQSSSASQQAAAITETTATVDQVKASVEQIARTALRLVEASQATSRAAADGVAAVDDSVAGMADLREKVQSIAENILALAEQSKQIGEIITTVSELADQSNLLALNAAIEASRAGEQGKGFAVVAAEVRTLAEQSKAATAQVRAILSDIQRATNASVMVTEEGSKGAEAGLRLISRAGQTIQQLVEAVEAASRQGEQIEVGVRQHAVGMEQVAVAMGNIKQAAGQSLAATESTRHAAELLRQQAIRLQALAHRYQL